MGKTLIMILCLSCFISFSFAASRTDKYQSIKEGGDYYNQLQKIYQSEDYMSRHNNAVSKCITNSEKMNANKRPCILAYNGNLHELGGTCGDTESIRKFCENPSNGMTDEEYKIYEYVENEDTTSTRAIMDNQCYQSMNGYYDEKEDKCLCEDGNHLENNICVKDEAVKEAEEVKGEDKEIEEDKIVCTEQYEPICGKDGKLYSNKCFMEVAGVEEDTNLSIVDGKCEKSIVQEPEESKNEEVDNRPEIEQAISWMFEKGLTVFNEPISFMAYNGLRRDEAAKFFVKYAKEVMGMIPDYSKQGCTFKDLDEAWSDLKDVIVESCQLGLFQGNKGKFMPTQKLTNAQAITVFMRLREGYKDESGSHFANNYYESAHAQGFLYDTPLDYKANFDNYTTRGDVAKMLFRGQKK